MSFIKLPKFIICLDGTFRLGQVNQHKDLLKPDDQCIGGGYYFLDFVSNRIILDRESHDFGRPRWHLLDMLRVPSIYRGMRIVYKYDDGFHDDFNVSDELGIEYYDCKLIITIHTEKNTNPTFLLSQTAEEKEQRTFASARRENEE